MKENSRNKWISFGISACGVMALSQMLLQEGRGLGYTNSFLPVLVLALSFPTVHRTLWETGEENEQQESGTKNGMRKKWCKRKCFFTLFLSAAFVVCCSVGSRLEACGYLPLNDWKMWIVMPFSSLYLAVMLEGLFRWAERRSCFSAEIGRTEACSEKKTRLWQKRLGIAAFFLVIWGIVLLAVWPGFFVFDAQDEFIQVETRNFTTHHPLPHVLLLGGIISAGKKLFGSYNAGIVCYMLFQMTVMACCFTYVWDFLRRKEVPDWLRKGSVLYFAFFPVIQMYVLCSAKDTLYTAGMLLVIVLLIEAAEAGTGFWKCKGRAAALIGSLVLMGSMRNNGLYILILMIPVMGLLGSGRKWVRQRKTDGESNHDKEAFSRKAGGKGEHVLTKAAAGKAGWYGAAAGVSALILCLILSGGLQTLFRAAEGGSQEMLTVPIQQLARTWKQEPELFSPEEEKILFSYLPEEALELYRPKLSDPVKYHFANETYAENPADFWKLWGRIGLRAPAAYLNAWMMTSYGFWYPEAVFDVYQGNQVFTFTYEDSSFFGFETELPGTRESKLPFLEEFYRKVSLELYQQRMPLLSMLFSPGFFFWVYLTGMVWLLRCRKYRLAACFLPVFLNWLTVLLGPTYVVRYVLIWWFVLPVLAAVIWDSELLRGTQGKGFDSCNSR